jgi:hypothetical protein
MLRATRESNPGCQWVFDGEGVATRKYDGACCMVRDGKLYKRRELGPKQSAPAVRLAVSRGDTRTGDGSCSRGDDALSEFQQPASDAT